MDNEEPESPAAEAVTALPGPSDPAAGPDAEAPASDLGPMSRTELRLRQLTGRKARYDGPIVAIARGWVSRDGKYPLFAARFLDFAVLTPEHLALCSTGFFTRRPRRQVFREALGRLDVTAIGPEPIRSLRVVGNFSRPIRLELRPTEAGLTFARELLAATLRNGSAEGPASS